MWRPGFHRPESRIADKKERDRKRKEEKKERNNNRIWTAERINYINNINYYIVSYTTTIRVTQHIQHILDSYKHLSSFYNIRYNTDNNDSEINTAELLYLYSAEASCSIAPPDNSSKQTWLSWLLVKIWVPKSLYKTEINTWVRHGSGVSKRFKLA